MVDLTRRQHSLTPVTPGGEGAGMEGSEAAMHRPLVAASLSSKRFNDKIVCLLSISGIRLTYLGVMTLAI